MAETKQTYGKNSQARRLRAIIHQSRHALGLGVIMVILLYAATIYAGRVSDEQLESTMLLNQYRLGSKTLTAAVQSYAVTGDEQYRQAYKDELNIDCNRDKALEGLEENDIKEDEWEQLQQIAALSDGLVPLEEAAMESVASGDSQSATDYVFGEEYMETINQINTLTDETIDAIQTRLGNKEHIIFVIQVIIAVLFLASFDFMVYLVVKTSRFAEKELLQPILHVATEMTELSQGNLGSPNILPEDDSEVGKLAAAIHAMKHSVSSIIEETSGVLARMGQGDYRVNLTQEYIGDYQRIYTSFYQIAEDMKELMSTIQAASEEINTGSGQLADAAEELAVACTSQAGQVSDIMLLISELNEQIAASKKDTEEAIKISNLAISTMTLGKSQMNELKQTSDQVIDRLGQLMELVTDEHGAELMNAAAEAVTNNISIMEEAIVNMEDVILSSTEVGERLTRIDDGLAVEENGIGKICENVSAVAGVVDNNSATSEETAAISEEQKSQVEALAGMIAKFQM